MSGTISGLTAAGLVLRLTDTTTSGLIGTLNIASGATTFEFGSAKVLSGHTYAVTVATQPSPQYCTVNSGTVL